MPSIRAGSSGFSVPRTIRQDFPLFFAGSMMRKGMPFTFCKPVGMLRKSFSPWPVQPVPSPSSRKPRFACFVRSIGYSRPSGIDQCIELSSSGMTFSYGLRPESM